MAGAYVADWSGRAEDILFMDVNVDTSSGTQRVPLSFGDVSRYVAGIQKCVQAFLSLLLTRRGTAIKAETGSDFMSVIQQQLVRTESDLRNQFARAVSQVAEQINIGIFEPDERFAAATVLSASVERQQMSLTILLTTEAGQSATFLVPIERLA